MPEISEEEIEKDRLEELMMTTRDSRVQMFRRTMLGVEVPEGWSKPRRIMALGLYGAAAELFVGIVTLWSFVIILVDTDINAKGSETPTWVEVCNYSALIVFTIELFVRAYVEREHIIESSWNWLDIFVVFSGWLCIIMAAVGMPII